jgi:acyl-homoserine lactone acylase PvdQ
MTAESWADGLSPAVAAYVRAHLDAVRADTELRLRPADYELEQYATQAKAEAQARWEALTEPERAETIPALARAMLATARPL